MYWRVKVRGGSVCIKKCRERGCHSVDDCGNGKKRGERRKEERARGIAEKEKGNLEGLGKKGEKELNHVLCQEVPRMPQWVEPCRPLACTLHAGPGEVTCILPD